VIQNSAIESLLETVLCANLALSAWNAAPTIIQRMPVSESPQPPMHFVLSARNPRKQESYQCLT
jgi:hypothetical protein